MTIDLEKIIFDSLKSNEELIDIIVKNVEENYKKQLHNIKIKINWEFDKSPGIKINDRIDIEKKVLNKLQKKYLKNYE